jgi:hypothetical protein
MSKDAYWSRFVTTRSGLVLVLFLGLPGVLCAQKEQDSWSALNGLKAGRGIEVIESHMQRHAGEFVNVTDGVLSLQEGGSDVSIKREDIVRVSTSSAPRRGEHAVIGLVVGGDQDSISSKETTTMKLRSLCVADSTQVPRLIRFSGVALDETHKPMTGMLVDRGSGLSPPQVPSGLKRTTKCDTPYTTADFAPCRLPNLEDAA